MVGVVKQKINSCHAVHAEIISEHSFLLDTTSGGALLLLRDCCGVTSPFRVADVQRQKEAGKRSLQGM